MAARAGHASSATYAGGGAPAAVASGTDLQGLPRLGPLADTVFLRASFNSCSLAFPVLQL